MEKCITCEGVYNLEESTAKLQECYCSLKCQEELEELMEQQIQFVEE